MSTNTPSTSVGSLPKHAAHPDVQAALADLRPLAAAALHGEEVEVCPEARGIMVEPRGGGRVGPVLV